MGIVSLLSYKAPDGYMMRMGGFIVSGKVRLSSMGRTTGTYVIFDINGWGYIYPMYGNGWGYIYTMVIGGATYILWYWVGLHISYDIMGGDAYTDGWGYTLSLMEL